LKVLEGGSLLEEVEGILRSWEVVMVILEGYS
jgi:hypothetical protein